jgi:hypothetical protein
MPVITQRRLLNCQSLLFRQQHSVYISLYYAFIYGAFIRTLYDATIMAFMLFIQQNHIYYVTAPSIISTIELINREPIAPLSPERFFFCFQLSGECSKLLRLICVKVVGLSDREQRD